ncbi:MAG: acetate--CoA ligase [Alphaproteobacteria bacterium]
MINSMPEYQALYQESITQPQQFWGRLALEKLLWNTPFTKVLEGGFSPSVDYQWFADGTLNAAYNCLDRHLETRPQQLALIWEGDNEGEVRQFTYQALHESVCRLANGLQSLGVSKGDRVAIYLPLIPEAVVAMLACARIGAIHSVVFGGFSAHSLEDRIQDCGASILITADEGLRGGKKIALKAQADIALQNCADVRHVVVVQRTGGEISWKTDRDQWFHELCAAQPVTHQPVMMGAEDPLFILYTSGSTGRPKGVVHTNAGYLLQAALTHEWVFGCREGEIFWCTADIGWITGHSYVVYGPLLNGTTVLIHEGVPNFPDPARWWRMIDRHGVNIFYTAPTAIRAMMRDGDAYVKSSSRASLRLLGSVGEPINPEAWRWYHDVVGEGRCDIVDTWWQTETGGIMISPIAGVTPLKAGSATLPLPGVQPILLDAAGHVQEGEAEGMLCITHSWPGQARTLYRDHARFEQTYFHSFAGQYFTGDGARRDGDGYYWITGRVDDVLNVAGHRLGTAEIESALVAAPQVAEAAVVGYPHDIKGQGVYAYVTLMAGITPTPELEKSLKLAVREQIGAIATPDIIQFASGLPKTRSGKIMRRILRKIAEGELEQLGDTSTLADPLVVDELIKGRIKTG